MDIFGDCDYDDSDYAFASFSDTGFRTCSTSRTQSTPVEKTNAEYFDEIKNKLEKIEQEERRLFDSLDGSKEVELNDGRCVNGIFQYSFLKTILETTENIKLKEHKESILFCFVLFDIWRIILWHFKDLEKEGLIRIDDLPKGLKTGFDFSKFGNSLKIRILSLFENGEREGEFITFSSRFFKDISCKSGIVKNGKEIKTYFKKSYD